MFKRTVSALQEPAQIVSPTHAHHPSTHTQVVVLEKGVVEQGTRDELISQGGVCKQLVLRQLLEGTTQHQ